MRFLFLFVFLVSSVFGRQNYVIYDDHFSPFAGGYDLLTTYEGMMIADDFLMDIDHGRRKTMYGSHVDSVDTLARMLNSYAWYILSAFTTTTQHEVFGHGFRVRELKQAEVTGYSIGLGGYTAFKYNPYEMSGTEYATIMIGGIEAQDIMASQLKMQFMSDRSIDGRAGVLYFRNQLALTSYAFHPDTLNDPYSNEQTGNDVKIYLRYLNDLYSNDPATITSIQKSSLLNLLDPVLWFSSISFWKYIVSNAPLELPTIKYGDFHMLPSFKTCPTPYGIEFYAQNYMAFGDRPCNVYIRSGWHKYPSFGLGGEAPHIWTIRDLVQVGIIGNVWLQPRLNKTRSLARILEGEPIAQPGFGKLRSGIQLSVVSTIPLEKSKTVSTYCEVGGKTKGYIPGYALDKALIVRGGLGLRF